MNLLYLTANSEQGRDLANFIGLSPACKTKYGYSNGETGIVFGVKGLFEPLLKGGRFEYEISERHKKMWRNIRNVIRKCDSLVIATDIHGEQESIVRNMVKFSGYKGVVFRAPVVGYQHDLLRDSLGNLKNAINTQGVSSEFEFLSFVNSFYENVLTNSLVDKAMSSKLFVKKPKLKIKPMSLLMSQFVGQAEFDFIQRDVTVGKAVIQVEGVEFELDIKKSFKPAMLARLREAKIVNGKGEIKLEELQSLNDLVSNKTVVVKDVVTEVDYVEPMPLYDYASLLLDAVDVFQLSPELVNSALASLYASKSALLTSYLTSNRKVSPRLLSSVRKSLTQLAKLNAFSGVSVSKIRVDSIANLDKPKQFYVEPIIPVLDDVNRLSRLSPVQSQVFTLLASRLIANTQGATKRVNKVITLGYGDFVFSVKGSYYSNGGWVDVDHATNSRNKDDLKYKSLEQLEIGQSLGSLAIKPSTPLASSVLSEANIYRGMIEKLTNTVKGECLLTGVLWMVGALKEAVQCGLLVKERGSYTTTPVFKKFYEVIPEYLLSDELLTSMIEAGANLRAMKSNPSEELGKILVEVSKVE